MKKTEVCRKITDLGNGKRTIVYSITLDDKDSEIPVPQYGASIRIIENGEEATIGRITTKREEIEKLLDLLATNHVTPVALEDIVYDWIG